MASMQCKVEWPVAGPSGCKLTSSQLSGIKHANPNVSPYLAVVLFEKNYMSVLCHSGVSAMRLLLVTNWGTTVIWTVSEASVCTSQETHYVSAAEPNRLMLFGETVAVYCENHTEHINTLCGQNARDFVYKNSVRTSQETHYVSATETNRLMLFGEIIAVYCLWESYGTLCGQNEGIESDTHSNYSGVKVYVQIINIINSITEEDCGG
jgi:hypothetical protein